MFFYTHPALQWASLVDCSARMHLKPCWETPELKLANRMSRISLLFGRFSERLGSTGAMCDWSWTQIHKQDVTFNYGEKCYCISKLCPKQGSPDVPEELNLLYLIPVSNMTHHCCVCVYMGCNENNHPWQVRSSNIK